MRSIGSSVSSQHELLYPYLNSFVCGKEIKNGHHVESVIKKNKWAQGGKNISKEVKLI
jgi:hypothetical protein